MTGSNLTQQLDNCSAIETTVLSLLALHGEPLGKLRLLECLRMLGAADEDGDVFVAATIADVLALLCEKELAIEAPANSVTCVDGIVLPVIRIALAGDGFGALCRAAEAATPVGRTYDGYMFLRTYRQALARLRMALLQAQPPERIALWLDTCARFPEFRRRHPYVELFGMSFDPELLGHLHPALQDDVMIFLLSHAQNEPENVEPLRAWSEQRLVCGAWKTEALTLALAEHLLLRGRLSQVEALLKNCASAAAGITQAAMLLLRGEQEKAIAGFDNAIKALRKESGKRNVFVDGSSGVFCVLAMMRSSEPRHKKLAESFFTLAQRSSQGSQRSFAALVALHDARIGTQKAEPLPTVERAIGDDMLPALFHALTCYWLGQPLTAQTIERVAQVYARAQTEGFGWVAAQAAALLARLGESAYREPALSLRREHGLDDLCDWFEHQEPWERQLAALMELRRADRVAAKTEAPGRLVWMINYDPSRQSLEIEPREQRRDTSGEWGKGRPVALKRLRDETDALDFLMPQDRAVLSAIGVSTSFYRGVSYDIDNDKALLALIGHPLMFWQDTPEQRVELLSGTIELMLTEQQGTLQLGLQPPVDHSSRREVLIVMEGAARLRIFSIKEEHRQIAAIIDHALVVPLHAKAKLLQAVGAVSTLVPVQSDIATGVDDIDAAPVNADTRLHVHLLPYGDGLKMQLLIKPFGPDGASYMPGKGRENVIADVAGNRLQAKRDLAAERMASARLLDACPALADAVDAHGDWYLAEPQHCLELLMQLQRCPDILLAWPQGERFRIVAEAGPQQLQLSVKSDRDWFEANGALRIDDKTVLDLRRLLFDAQQGQGRFIALDGNRFVALTEEFHRRIAELANVSQFDGEQIQVHPLAASALAELADDAGTCDSDAAWMQHVSRLGELDDYVAQVPGTLQAELRDYQLAGFQRLARLAHWKVGACLADDMGLGKTIQTLGLLLLRAPQGPALVVAPTSVCPNWMSETARFAPTLKVVLFGSGERTLDGLQGFDVVVVSYGLLQQEAERFSAVRWSTIVLDEAQAIKNAQTKRSQAVMGLQGAFKMALSGTPIENHLGELWSLFRFINPGLLGSAEEFNERFALPIERHKNVRVRTRLRRLIQPFLLRRTKAQVLAELPSRTEMVRHVDLTNEETALYEALRRIALERLEKDDMPATQKALQIVTELMKLRRACCNPNLVAPDLGLTSSKLEVFGELLDELLENRHKALVFSQFVDHLSLIRAWLDQRGVRYQYLDGSTPMQERKKRVEAFQAGDGDVFLISLKAGGTGLNLTAADYVIHMDPWWNPAVEDQASDRAHRIGQQRPVTIYRLIARHTIEEGIVELHKRKRELAESLLDGGEGMGGFSTQEMLALLRLELGRFGD
ncbi:DEAD/DEAH box helicase [Noviherbaspirillum saxi]|uniref:DEAD/DEAH box helicase n=1 Tax=Noviherbaspirillum saxi TaxID=2320863 RepID=A0A3A3FMA5_9BURK|nr:DEAD/DEAH box helicase [Noviherbaspirillum saxi]RJF97312.1 DEAD/DEAH box helicase [Noviherbaspirillum saxi]